MSPKQRRERHRELEQEVVNRFIGQEYTIFRHDEALRAKTIPELVAALRRLKTRLTMQLKAAKHCDWVENTETLIDMKIEDLLALNDAPHNGKVSDGCRPRAHDGTQNG